MPSLLQQTLVKVNSYIYIHFIYHLFGLLLLKPCSSITNNDVSLPKLAEIFIVKLHNLEKEKKGKSQIR